MSTRGAIILKTANGYSGIYVHYDSYLSGVGQTLFSHYQDPAKVAALIALGDISELGERVDPTGDTDLPHSYVRPERGVTVAYMRDRGETDCEARTGATIEDVESQIGHNGYVYVYDDGWTVNGKTLETALKEGEDES